MIFLLISSVFIASVWCKVEYAKCVGTNSIQDLTVFIPFPAIVDVQVGSFSKDSISFNDAVVDYMAEQLSDTAARIAFRRVVGPEFVNQPSTNRAFVDDCSAVRAQEMAGSASMLDNNCYAWLLGTLASLSFTFPGAMAAPANLTMLTNPVWNKHDSFGLLPEFSVDYFESKMVMPHIRIEIPYNEATLNLAVIRNSKVTINGLTESHPNVVVDVAYDCHKEQLNVAPCGRVHCEPRGRFGGCRCDHYDEADVYMATCTEDWGVNVGGDVTTTSSSSSVQTLTPAPSYSTTVQPAPTPTQMATTRLIISENTSGTLDTTSSATQSLTPSSIAPPPFDDCVCSGHGHLVYTESTASSECVCRRGYVGKHCANYVTNHLQYRLPTESGAQVAFHVELPYFEELCVRNRAIDLRISASLQRPVDYSHTERTLTLSVESPHQTVIETQPKPIVCLALGQQWHVHILRKVPFCDATKFGSFGVEAPLSLREATHIVGDTPCTDVACSGRALCLSDLSLILGRRSPQIRRGILSCVFNCGVESCDMDEEMVKKKWVITMQNEHGVATTPDTTSLCMEPSRDGLLCGRVSSLNGTFRLDVQEKQVNEALLVGAIAAICATFVVLLLLTALVAGIWSSHKEKRRARARQENEHADNNDAPHAPQTGAPATNSDGDDAFELRDLDARKTSITYTASTDVTSTKDSPYATTTSGSVLARGKRISSTSTTSEDDATHDPHSSTASAKRKHRRTRNTSPDAIQATPTGSTDYSIYAINANSKRKPKKTKNKTTNLWPRDAGDASSDGCDSADWSKTYAFFKIQIAKNVENENAGGYDEVAHVGDRHSTESISSDDPADDDNGNDDAAELANIRNAPDDDVFARLRVGGLLGSGAFGDVFAAKLGERRVAVKRLALGKLADTDRRRALSSFERECRLMRGLPPHRHVLGMLGAAVGDEHAALITEYCGGGSLDVRVRTRPFKPRQLLVVASDVAKGVAHLHAHGIVHRDLAARNLLLSDDNVVKVCDFGLACEALADQYTRIYADDDAGPVRWSAPESIEHCTFSVKSDVWSYGVAMWELAARQRPYAELSLPQAALAIAKGSPTLQQPSGKRMSEPLWSLIVKHCWQRQAEQRLPMSHIATRLASLLADEVRHGGEW